MGEASFFFFGGDRGCFCLSLSCFSADLGRRRWDTPTMTPFGGSSAGRKWVYL